MDDFGQFLMGGQAKPNPQANPVGGVNQYNVGNLRPVGSSTGFQQPSSYEEGIKAMDDNLRIYGTKHGINTLRGVISRYAPPQDKNDTEGYINFVAQRTGLKPDQEIDLSNPAVRHVISGPMILMEKGGKNIFGAKSAVAQTTAQPTAKEATDDFSSFLMGGKAEPTKEEPKKATPKIPRLEERKNLVKGLASLADIALEAVPSAAGQVVYAGGRALGQTPEEATKTAQKVSGAVPTFGKTFGITEDPAYKQEATRRIMGQIGEYIGESADVIAQKTGIPKQDVENMLATLGVAVGSKLPSPKTTALKLQEQFDNRFPKTTQAPAVAPVAPTLTGIGAAKTEINPYAGKITGEESARGQYPVVKLSKIKQDVPATEQQLRSQIANEVLGDTGQVRSGVITGNENTLRQEYTEARSANPTPRSELLKRQIAEEQNALTRYAEKRIEASGASRNLPTDYERGQLMNDAIAGDDGLTGFLKQQKQALYDEARNKVGDNPIQTNAVNNLLQNKQFRAGLGLRGNEGVAKSAEQLIELARTVGFEDRAGNILPPNSIAAWKAVRESLNGEWTKDNASVIRKINDAIDQDIAKAGGQDLYKKADNLHKAEKKIFESKGIKTLFGDVDPNGVQTATNFEAIPKKLNSMPVDQWKHIYDTYDEISKGRVRGAGFDLEITPELVQYAEAAKAEMRGALAREIFQAGGGKAGVWNQNSVNNLLNNPIRAKKIEHAFSPDEQRAFHTLNYAGHIMPGVHSYEGAALQAQRVSKFAEKLPMIGREVGAVTRVPFGATIGEKVGEKAALFTIGKSEKKQAQKLQEEMAKNAQKGKTNLKDIGKE